MEVIKVVKGTVPWVEIIGQRGHTVNLKLLTRLSLAQNILPLQPLQIRPEKSQIVRTIIRSLDLSYYCN